MSILIQKKGTLGFVIEIIIIIVILGLAFYKLAQFFGLYKTERGFETYNELTAAITDMKFESPGSRKSVLAAIDKQSAIMGFAKDSNGVALVDAVSLASLVAARPAKCEQGKACVCICRDYEMAWTAIAAGFKCNEDLICTRFDNITFPYKMKEEDYGTDYGVEGGFFIGRDPLLLGADADRYSSIFVEKGIGNLIGICFDTPCITAEVQQREGQRKAADKFFNDAMEFYTKKNYKEALRSFNEIFNKDVLEYFDEDKTMEIYYLRALSAYNIYAEEFAKGNKMEKIEGKETLEYFKEAFLMISKLKSAKFTQYRNILVSKQNEIECLGQCKGEKCRYYEKEEGMFYKTFCVDCGKIKTCEEYYEEERPFEINERICTENVCGLSCNWVQIWDEQGQRYVCETAKQPAMQPETAE